MDATPEVVKFAQTLERVCVDTVESGKMTKDLAILIRPDHPFLTTEEYMEAVDAEMQRRMR
jgi:isocitrate dehydrogenase